MFKVAKYKRPSGRIPYDDFRASLSRIQSEAVSVDVLVSQLSERGSHELAQTKGAKKLNDVWELRPKNQRVYYFYDSEHDQYVLLHGHKKQRQKAGQEIYKAERMRKDYLERTKKGEQAWSP